MFAVSRKSNNLISYYKLLIVQLKLFLLTFKVTNLRLLYFVVILYNA